MNRTLTGRTIITLATILLLVSRCLAADPEVDLEIDTKVLRIISDKRVLKGISSLVQRNNVLPTSVTLENASGLFPIYRINFSRRPSPEDEGSSRGNRKGIQGVLEAIVTA